MVQQYCNNITRLANQLEAIEQTQLHHKTMDDSKLPSLHCTLLPPGKAWMVFFMNERRINVAKNRGRDKFRT